MFYSATKKLSLI